MKVAKRDQQAAATQSASEILAARNFCPLSRLMDLVDEEVEAPDDENTLRSMLCTDYEIAPTGKLRYRARMRGEWLMELARYQHARKKAVDTIGPTNLGLVVEIKNYPAPDVTVVESSRSLSPSPS